MMKVMRKAGKAAMIAMSAVMTLMLIVSMVGAATREENVKKIERFLSNDAVKTGLTEKGETYERVMRNVGTMSDTQVEKLAEHATVQVGGEIKDSGDDFWSFYKWYLIASLVVFVIIIAAA